MPRRHYVIDDALRQRCRHAASPLIGLTALRFHDCQRFAAATPCRAMPAPGSAADAMLCASRAMLLRYAMLMPLLLPPLLPLPPLRCHDVAAAML